MLYKILVIGILLIIFWKVTKMSTNLTRLQNSVANLTTVSAAAVTALNNAVAGAPSDETELGNIADTVDAAVASLQTALTPAPAAVAE